MAGQISNAGGKQTDLVHISIWVLRNTSGQVHFSLQRPLGGLALFLLYFRRSDMYGQSGHSKWVNDQLVIVHLEHLVYSIEVKGLIFS